MEKGYRLLAIAILNRAVSDYRLIQQQSTEYMSAFELRHTEYQLQELEQFFLSDYGMLLSHGLGKEIVQRLKQERKGKKNE